MEKQQRAMSKRVGPGKSVDIKGLLKVVSLISSVFTKKLLSCSSGVDFSLSNLLLNNRIEVT